MRRATASAFKPWLKDHKTTNLVQLLSGAPFSKIMLRHTLAVSALAIRDSPVRRPLAGGTEPANVADRSRARFIIR